MYTYYVFILTWVCTSLISMTHKPVPQYQGLTEPHKPFTVVMIINNNNISQLQLKINPLAKITNY